MEPEHEPNIIYNTIASGSWLRINKKLCSIIGIDATVLMADLLAKSDFFGREDFYHTVENIERDTTLSSHKQREAIKMLESKQLIKTYSRGLPAKRYFSIEVDTLTKILQADIVQNTVSPNAYWVFNKHLAFIVGIDAALLVADLLSKSTYFNQDEFFNTADNVERDTSLSYHKQKKALKVLEKFKVVRYEIKGIPPKRFFKIDEAALVKLLNKKTTEQSFKKSDCKQSENLKIKQSENLKISPPKISILYNNIELNKKEKEIERGSRNFFSKNQNYLDLTISADPNFLNEEEKRARINAIHTELKNSQIWIEDLRRITKKSEFDTWHMVKQFLDNLKAADDFYKPLSEIKKHCVNRLRKIFPEIS